MLSGMCCNVNWWIATSISKDHSAFRTALLWRWRQYRRSKYQQLSHAATWSHIPEDLNILKHCCDNIKSHKAQKWWWQKQSFRTHLTGSSSFYAPWFWLTWGCDFSPSCAPWVKWFKGHVHVRVTLLAMDCEHNTLSGTKSQLKISKHK